MSNLYDLIDGVNAEFFEKTYEEREVIAIFLAIYAGQINRIVIDKCFTHENTLDFNIAPVVFCKDCKHRDKKTKYCHHPENTRMESKQDDWFCKDGEKEKPT